MQEYQWVNLLEVEGFTQILKTIQEECAQRGIKWFFPITFTVAQMGSLNRPEAENAVDLANKEQQAFHFEWYLDPLPLDKRYRLPNSSFDLDTAAKHLLQRFNLPLPLILLTSDPYGIWEKRREAEWFLFSEQRLPFNPKVSIVSTYLWDRLPGQRRLQPYLLLELATIIFANCCPSLAVHDEARGCLFDYCDDPKDYDRSFEFGCLCDECERHLRSQLRNEGITVEQIAAAKKLYNRALGKRVCFVAMPSKREVRAVYNVISRAFESEGWTVIRSVKTVDLRYSPDKTLQAILMSSLVVADITGNDTNVSDDIVIARAAGCELILLTQEQNAPFDVKTERTIFYETHKRGLQKLENELGRLAKGDLS